MSKKSAGLSLKLTKALVDGLEFDPEVSAEPDRMRCWDTALRGFAVVVHRSGRKTFEVMYRTKDGRQRKMTLGAYGILTVEEARAQARQALAAAARGEDPMGERTRVRRAQTLEAFWRETYLPEAIGRWKATTLKENTRVFEKLILPDLGSQRMEALRRAEVEAWLRKHRGTPGQANLALRLLKAVFNRAVELEVITGPFVGAKVRPFALRKRERFLTPEEVAALWQAIAEEEALGGKAAVPREGQSTGRGGRGLREAESRGITVHTAGLFRVLLLTGARLREIMAARWDWVRWEERVLALPDSKTGAKRLPLSEPVLEELRRLRGLRSVDNPWIIEGVGEGTHLINATKPWYRVLARAEEVLRHTRAAAQAEPPPPGCFKGVRLHDLRHSFASLGVAAGLNLPMIGKALGHASSSTTARYSHLADGAGLFATDQVGNVIMAAIRKRAEESPDGGGKTGGATKSPL